MEDDRQEQRTDPAPLARDPAPPALMLFGAVIAVALVIALLVNLLT
jgi:hypothetical protein